MSARGTLRDGFGRSLQYLRLSVTDRCNFRCVYCLPGGCPKARGQPLSAEEIARLVRGFAGLGFWKVRVTGGEPCTRADICEVVERIARTPGVRRVGLTTNGHRLASLAAGLRDAGLHALNVSLDSLDRARFAEVTGRDRLPEVVAGIEAAVAAGIPSIKVNTVLLRGLEDTELDRLLDFTRRMPVTVRFIELMQTGDNADFFRRAHLPADEVRQRLAARGWVPQEKSPSDGPAAMYRHPDHQGKAGLIAPYSTGFCASCNRLRVSSTGDLRLCLFGEEQVPLRPLLQRDDQEAELWRTVERAVRAKPESHALREGRCGVARNLAAIGG
ncbi:GTP 3',8-cyclase MoaA [Anaeromyxobacter paludicola]|uniref:GTP 3',8-cyclase n=1 Tax=Anaeromyxobacter paludicola TaxID=2918171 RepID=A0ABM7XDW4_9BACT|nr:GTP 3',8-cyclase MoaA [Anaeromyxobacter paludicola]BDG10068.1 GTP 3',8-cyclase [Anaeromyxobacter paludicola]